MVAPYDSIKPEINFTHGELPLTKALKLARRFYPSDDDIYQQVCKGDSHYCIHSLADACERLVKIIDTYHAALVEIRDNKHCVYANNSFDSYGTGVTDGHRFCSHIARQAIEEVGK